jgi:transposase
MGKIGILGGGGGKKCGWGDSEKFSNNNRNHLKKKLFYMAQIPNHNLHAKINAPKTTNYALI